MDLFKVAGLQPSHPELGSREWIVVLGLLEEHACYFLRVGTVTLRDWVRLSSIERVAFVRAAEKERLMKLAETNPDRAAAEAVPLDDGEGMRIRTLAKVVSAAMERVRYGSSG